MSKFAETDEVRKVVESLYKLAGVNPVWKGEVNEKVAQVVGVMLLEVAKCSKAFLMVPKPPGGRATISWLAATFGRGLFDRYRAKMSASCARAVIYSWRTELEMASNGLTSVRVLKTPAVHA